MRILVVDSDCAALAQTSAVLRDRYPDAQLVAMDDGMEAVQYSLHHPVDAVYTEVLMPRINGFGVARLVRQFQPRAAAYLLSRSDAYLDTARLRGLSGYYLKPLARDTLETENLLVRNSSLRCGSIVIG